MEKYKSKFAYLVAKLVKYPKPELYAVTVGQTTYYSCSKTNVDARPHWRLHEQKHQEQYKRLGVVKFLVKYFWYQLKFGYKENPLEIEAREAEKI